MSTKFKDSVPGFDADLAAHQAETAALQQRIDQLEENINAFNDAVIDVTFNVNEEDAEPWMSNWRANLLSGKIG